MSIDWITVAAQIANFLVLVWLLRRFLYRPILDGIDAREAEITTRMREASLAKDKAASVEAEFHDKTRALNVAQAELTQTVRKKAEEQRDALLAEAQQQREREHAAWQAHLADEARSYAVRMHGAGADALLSLTRKALVDLADDSLEERMAHHLVRQIQPMVADLTHAAGQASVAVITSRDTLPAAAQDGVAQEIKALFPGVDLHFAADPDQAPGLVLRMGGAQVAWTVDSYIDGLDALIADQLANGAASKASAHER